MMVRDDYKTATLGNFITKFGQLTGLLERIIESLVQEINEMVAQETKSHDFITFLLQMNNGKQADQQEADSDEELKQEVDRNIEEIAHRAVELVDLQGLLKKMKERLDVAKEQLCNNDEGNCCIDTSCGK